MLLVNLVLSQYNNRISVYGMYFGRYAVAICAGFCGVLGMFFLAQTKRRGEGKLRLLEAIGREHTTNILCTHYFLLRAMSGVSKYFFAGYDIWHNTGIGKAIICTGVIFLIEFAVVKLFRTIKIPATGIFKV